MSSKRKACVLYGDVLLCLVGQVDSMDTFLVLRWVCKQWRDLRWRLARSGWTARLCVPLQLCQRI